MAPLAPGGQIQITERPDDFSGRLPPFISLEKLRELSQLNPWRSFGQIGFEWAAVLAAAWACSRFWHPLFYVISVMWIGARQHALGVLMHDGAHYLFLRHKRWNDWIAEVLTAWPIFVTMRAYRKYHWEHHRYVNSARDPDWMSKQTDEWKFPKGWGELLRMLAKDMVGLNIYQAFLEAAALSEPPAKDGSHRRLLALRLAFYAAGLGVILATGQGRAFLLFWIVPWFTWLKMILRIRSIARHFGIEEGFVPTPETASGIDIFRTTRTTYPSWFERWFVAPLNINYHLDHHIYPSVPFYRLPQLHKALMAHPLFKTRAHITRTYWGVLRECVTCRGGLRPAPAAS